MMCNLNFSLKILIKFPAFYCGEKNLQCQPKECNSCQNVKLMALYATHQDKLWIIVNDTQILMQEDQARLSNFYVNSEQSKNKITVCQE